MDLLKFFTCGNVDDGKSTLIGRLLYDSGSVSTDILQTLSKQSKTTSGDTDIDLALLTDGLRAEREQGITIDVAYKYFTTKNRKFIIVDTPGHIQYTRNMVTGASNCDLAIILIDARNGLTEQTRRHSILASLLGMPHLVVCVNKMDIVDYSEDVFNKIKADFNEFAKPLTIKETSFIALSALAGDNVVHRSAKMPWFTGPTLLEKLESVIPGESDFNEPRFSVQYVVRPQSEELHDYRGYAGQVLSGTYKLGDKIKIYPSLATSTISKIESNLQEVDSISAPRAAIIHIADDVDISRGSSIVVQGHESRLDQEFKAILCWMDAQALVEGQKFLLQNQTLRVRASVREINSVIDIHTFQRKPVSGELGLNTICEVTIKTASPIAWDPYQLFRPTGGFILIHEITNTTVGAGMFQDDETASGI